MSHSHRSARLTRVAVPLFLFTLLAVLAPACATATRPHSDRRIPSSTSASTLTIDQRHEVFLAAWKAIRDKHFDPKMNGVDWEAVRARIAPKVDAAHGDEEFLAAMQEMIQSLGQSHIGVGP